MTIDQALQEAVAHFQAGRLPDVERLCRAILGASPDHPDALHLLGTVAHLCGHSAEAAAMIERSLVVHPNNAGAIGNLGEVYRALGRFDDAERAYRRSIELMPDNAAAHANLAIIVEQRGQPEEAIRHCLTAIRLDPHGVEAMNTLGNLYLAQKKYDTAIEWYRKVLAIRPDYALAVNNLGSALEQTEQIDAAGEHYARATQLQPKFADAWNNLGNVRQKQLDMDAARACFETAVRERPNFPIAHWNLGLLLLARGEYERAWPHYAWRMQCAHTQRYLRDYPGKSLWDGSPLNGRTLLLTSEQGYGDLILFARFIRRIAATGGRVIWEVPPEIRTLLAAVDGVADARSDARSDPVQPVEFDVHCPIMSVAGLLNLSLEECRSPPYLTADPAKRAGWRERFKNLPGRKIGLAWSGRPVPDPMRSCTLADLAPLFDLDNVSFVSLQKGPAAAALAASPAAGRVLDLNDDLLDFADTAAAIAELDHVISIDSAVAHLAGALGAPVTTLLTKPADWRWLLDRADSPWYPTTRLYRQTTRGDWGPVVARVATDLST